MEAGSVIIRKSYITYEANSSQNRTPCTMKIGNNVRMKDRKERLRFARQHAGFDSPSEAARAHSKINKNTLISHENGNRDFGKKAADTYSRVFNVSAAWLLTGEGIGPDGSSKSIDAKLRLLPPDDFEDLYNDFDAIIERRLERLHKN